MIIQKRSLDIAHSDADSNMSLTSVENKVNLNTWFVENSTPELLDKLDKGLDFMTPKEKRVIEALDISSNRPECSWLNIDKGNFSGVFNSAPERELLDSDINENLIVELYSK